MLSGRLDGDMNDQGKRGFIFSSAVGFGNLNLIALPLVAIVAGIGVRRVLQGIAGNLLVGADRDLFAVTQCPCSILLISPLRKIKVRLPFIRQIDSRREGK